MADNRPYYDIQFLNDIHNYFPDILYRPERFSTVASLLQYIRTQASARYDLFANAQRNHVINTPPMQNQTPIQAPASPSPPHLHRTRTRPYEVMPLNNLLTTLIGLGQLGQDQDINLNLNFMDAVQVAPSAQQVDRSTQLRQTNAQDETARCSICQDSFTSGQAIRFLRHCRHEFHRGCIDTWFQSNVHCPMCRWDIREDDDEEEGEIHE
jgi:hypothetical protein